MEDDKLINCGERTVQSMYRVSFADICKRYCIEIGDTVEMYIKIEECKK